MSAMDALRREPYRLLFPLGAVCAVVGIGVWIGFWLEPTIGYPGAAHALLQMHGFVLCFVVGFLLTMLPRALGLRPAATWHLVAFTAATVASIVAALAGATLAEGIAHLAMLAVPVAFIAPRLPERRSSPPAPFACVALGGVAAVAGAALSTAAPWLPAWLGQLGRGLDLQAFVLLMIVGVGAFLIPKLAGPSGRSAAIGGVASNLTLGGVLLASYAVEHVPWLADPLPRVRAAYALRALVFIGFLVRTVLPARLHRDAPPYLRGIPLALAWLTLGLVLPVAWPQHVVAFLHLVYVAGVMGITLIVATRVLVGHAADRPPPRAAIAMTYGALLVLASLTRVAAGIWPGRTYVLHLAIAALLALAALAVWTSILATRCWSLPDRSA